MSDIQREDREKWRTNMQPLEKDDPNNQIGIKLKSLYDAIQQEAIPDRFLELLEKLDQAERRALTTRSK